MTNKPNIVYFVADQMRADSLHHLGNPASLTPNLDHLAEEGISFRNAFCQNPVCVPSRCSFLSGLYPHTLGHRTMHFLQNADEPNILKTMKNNGYEVIWCGRNDVIPGDRDKSEYCDQFFSGITDEMRRARAAQMAAMKGREVQPKEPNYSFYVGETSGGMAAMDEAVVKSAVQYLQKKRESGDDKPFFLYVTLFLPHPPYAIGRPFYGAADRNRLPQRRPDLDQTKGKPSMLRGIHEKQGISDWPEEKFSELRGTYLDMVYRFDDLFGQLMNELNQGFRDNTDIFVFSDHGDYTGDYGIAEKVQNCFDDPVTNVPLIIAPAKSRGCAPRISDALVELTDLSATVYELTGTDPGYTHFSKSLTHLFEAETEHRPEVHCEGGRIHGETQCMELGHGRESEYWPRLSTQASEGPEHTKALMIRDHDYKYVKRLYEDDEFYDLHKDPMETQNRIHDPEYRDIVLDYEHRALDFLMGTADYVPNRRDKR